MATGIPNTEILFDLEALAGLENRLPPNVVRNIVGGIPQRNIPVVQPTTDPTYRSGFDYARSIAGGIPMEQVIAPGVSYSPEMPGGYTQAQLNTPVGTTPVEPPPPVQEPDIPSFLGTGIGGVRIPVDRDIKMPPLRDIFGGVPMQPPVQTPPAIDIDAIRQQIAESGIDFGNLLGIPKYEAPDLSQFVRREDVPSLIPDVPTGRDFSVDREQLIEDIRSGIDLPVYEKPDLSQFVRREDIPSLIPSVPTGRDFSIDREELIKDIREGIEIPKYEMPDLSQFARLEDIPTVPTLDREALIRDITGRIDIPKPPSIDRQALIEDIRSGIELPTYQAPDLSGFARLEDIPKIPSREDFLSIAREGIEIPQYQAPDFSGFARLEDIPTFDPTGLQEQIAANQAAIAGINIPTYQIPDVSQFVTQEDIQKAIAGIDMPTYQAPDLSAYDVRLAELEQQLAGLQQPTGGRFSISQPAPRGLI